jgi:hypothetical protein
VFHNVVVGKPIVDVSCLLAVDEKDWEENEKKTTLFTETRFLPAIMKEAGIVQSTGEVRRNKKELCISLDNVDCINLKWGKKFLFIVVGE